MNENTHQDQLGGDQVRCVWSSHHDHVRNCPMRIPRVVILAAWDQYAAREGVREGFFHITWGGGVWLAYGVQDGGVRGVYCPTHCAQRDAREAPSAAAREAAAPVWAVAV
jgi:hypothetical protein